MPRKPQERILHLARVRSLPDHGSVTLHCVLSHRGELFDHIGFLAPGRYPEFEGEKAWVRVHWWSKTNYRVIEQVADRHGTPLTKAA